MSVILLLLYSLGDQLSLIICCMLLLKDTGSCSCCSCCRCCCCSCCCVAAVTAATAAATTAAAAVAAVTDQRRPWSSLLSGLSLSLSPQYAVAVSALSPFGMRPMMRAVTSAHGERQDCCCGISTQHCFVLGSVNSFSGSNPHSGEL